MDATRKGIKMKALLLLCITVSLYATSLQNLNPKQKQILHYVFNKAKQFNLEYTMTAIAWEESDFGKYRINITDGKYGSYGIFHILPTSLIRRTDLKKNGWNYSRLAERLISDNDFSFAAALLELKYWQNYYKSKNIYKVWSHTVASYNGGFKADLDSTYLKRIKHKIKLLKQLKELK